EVKSRAEQFTVGIVGYTNAGKSTLLNRLTKSDELVADMPFATLDTRTRKWRMSDGRSVLLSDTVGFLQRLPHHLVASFHATLEEAFNADLLLNVVDASHPDAANHIRAVDRVLKSLSGHLPPEIVLFNKVDRVDDPISLQLLVADDSKEVIYLSAHTGEGTDRLEQAVWRYLDDRSKVVDILIPISDGRTIARVRAHGAILEEDCGEEGTLRIRTRVSLPALGSLRREAGPGVDFRLLSPGS
ncbi:MAG: GTP-binding protein HflX, partial [Gammaproteobacteria bacterium]